MDQRGGVGILYDCNCTANQEPYDKEFRLSKMAHMESHDEVAKYRKFFKACASRRSVAGERATAAMKSLRKACWCEISLSVRLSRLSNSCDCGHRG